MSKIWEGRIQKPTDELVERFSSSLEVDKNLYIYDIIGSIGHLTGLKKAGIIDNSQLKKIAKGLDKVKQKIEGGMVSGYEDIHSLVESELIKEIGEIGKKIHAGRSRNDQVVLDEKLFLKDAIINLLHSLINLQKNLYSLANKEMDTIFIAYTHLQKAQPVLASHYLLSFFEKFGRDIESLEDNFESNDFLPLGAAACTGTGYDIDYRSVAEVLKFKNRGKNSMDIVGSRDFMLDFVFSCSKIMLHLSRISEDLIIYSSQEFSYIEIDESFCTGSSIMPQKKNPDVLELIRGKSSVVAGNLGQLFMLLKGLPSTYNRDLQEDKPILFSAYWQTLDCVNVFSKLVKNIRFNQDKITEKIKEGFMEATDVADYLAKKGESFRKSHNIVGKIVKYCIQNNIKFEDIKLDKLKQYSKYFDSDFYKIIDTAACINSKTVECGTAQKSVKANLEQCIKRIDNWEKKLKNLEGRIPTYEELTGKALRK